MTGEERAERELVAAMNRNLLVELMAQYGITIPAREFDQWRPTDQRSGHITGISDGLTCVMTNGLLAYFLRDGKEPLYGHVQHFMWDEPEVRMIPFVRDDGSVGFFKSVREQGAPSAYFRMSIKPKVKSPKKRKATKTGVEAAKALLDKLQMEMELL